MTVREFIDSLNPQKVLDGKISFKVILQSSKRYKYGDKWFFYCDQKENPEETTIEKFCNNSGISMCMNLEIDEITMEFHPEHDGPGTIYWHFEVMDEEQYRYE